jgi:hypothetical protein
LDALTLSASWPNRDPIQERGGVNLYCFVHNSPVSSVDMWGLSCESDYQKCKDDARQMYDLGRALINSFKDCWDESADDFESRCNEMCRSMGGDPSACRFFCGVLAGVGETGGWGGYVGAHGLNLVVYGAYLKACSDQYSDCVANRAGMPPVPNPVY